MAAFHLAESGLLAAQPDPMIDWLGASDAALIRAECGRYASFRQGHSARAVRRDLDW